MPAVSSESEFAVTAVVCTFAAMIARPAAQTIARRTFLAGTAAGLAAAAWPAGAAARRLTGVIELFTSQGCSSCPPADAALVDFAADPDVLALGYHVDYWDYLGWKDTLASPENTARQRAYAKTLGSRTVYTPQAVINGRAHMNGGDRSAIRSALRAHRASGDGLSVPVSVEVANDRLSVSVGDGRKPAGADTLLTIAYFRQRSAVEIERGENAGRRLVYANAVTAQRTLGMWDGGPMSIDLPKSKVAEHAADGCAVLLQMAIDGAPGPVLGAANLTGVERG